MIYPFESISWWEAIANCTKQDGNVPTSQNCFKNQMNRSNPAHKGLLNREPSAYNTRMKKTKPLEPARPSRKALELAIFIAGSALACLPVALVLAEGWFAENSAVSWTTCLAGSFCLLFLFFITFALALFWEKTKASWVALLVLLALDIALLADKSDPQDVRFVNQSSRTLHGVILALGGHFDAERRMEPGAEHTFRLIKDWKSLLSGEPFRVMRSTGGRYALLGTCGHVALSHKISWKIVLKPDGTLQCNRHVEDRRYAPFTTEWRAGDETKAMREMRREYEASQVPLSKEDR